MSVTEISTDRVSTPLRRTRRSLNSLAWNTAARPAMVAVSRAPFVGPTALTIARPALNSSLTALSPVPRGTRITTARNWHGDGQVRGEWTHVARRHGGGVPRPQDGRSILYYLHGSGFLICSTRTHRGLVSRLVRRSGIGAFALDYRLGPQHRFPTAGDDAIRGYRWLLDQGWAPVQIIVGGASAGGHLAQDLLAANHADGVPQPKAMLLLSPLHDPSLELAETYQRETGVYDPYIDPVAARRLIRFYTGDTPSDDPRMRIALTADLDVPDTLIQVGRREVLVGDARTIHRNVLDAGGRSQLQEWPGQSHVFQMFPYFTPESRKAMREAKDFIDRNLV